MSIKWKFIIILVLICSILGALAAETLWSYRKSKHQIQVVQASLDNLYAVSKVRSAIINQAVESIYYFFTNKVENKQQYENMEIIARRAYTEWVEAIRKSMELGIERTKAMDRAGKIETAYNVAEETIATAFELFNTGKPHEAYQLLENKVEFWINHVLSRNLDETLMEETREVNEAYDEVLVCLGAIPWGGAGSAKQLENARFSMNSFLAIEKVISGIRKEYKELMDYLVSGEEKDEKEFVEHGIEVEIALKDWMIIIQTQTKLEIGEKKELLKSVIKIEKKNNEFFKSARKAFELVKAGKREKMTELVENSLRPHLYNLLVSQLSEKIDQTRNKIDSANQRLLDIILASGIKAVLFSIVVSSIIIFVIISMLRGIMISLDRLRIGTEIIGKGGLEHRIGLKTGDELGRLALSFDKMAEALQRSRDEAVLAKEYTDNILHSMTDALFVVSPDGLIQTVNNSLCTLLGYEKDALIGRPVDDILDRGLKAKGLTAADIVGKGDLSAVEMTYLTKNGEKISVLFSSSLMRNDTGPIGEIVCVAQDITEKRILQAEAMHAAHLASLGELAAGVAHEINNPINSIINYAQILIDESGDENTSSDIADRILKDGDRIANIVKSLLSFARAGEEEKIEVHISELISDVLTLTETQLRKESIRVMVDIPGDLPEIIAHPQQIEQVFLNIINNARYALNQKYRGAHKDKLLEITGERVIIKKSPCVRMTFYDHGTGIPDHLLGKVIDPFFSSKPKGVGTGLGLSISHGIINDHGGSLKINSIEGEFTRIIIELPERRQS